MYWTQVTLALMGFVSIVKGTQYIFVNQSETWEYARNVCMNRGLNLSSLSQEDIVKDLQNCSLDGVAELWTSTFLYTTSYLSLVGCFKYTKKSTVAFKNASVIQCQSSCQESPRFAITNNVCTCLETEYNLGTKLNNEQCNYTCDDNVVCGGIDAVSVYEKVNVSSLMESQQVIVSNLSSNCVVYQCVNTSVTYQEKDCNDQSIKYASGYFSCTFEPGDDCFLAQVTWDDFDWSIQNMPLRNNSAYEPSYYAYAKANGEVSNQAAILVSSTNLKASTWCLRFRYFASGVTSMDVMILDIIENTTESIVQIRNPTKTSVTEPEWYNVEHNITSKNDFKLLFWFIEANNSSTISIDDVTLILGNCEETMTVLLNQRGKYRCTFGGNVSMCFRQDMVSDQADWNLSFNQAWLGPYKKEKPAILISTFELQDVNITICLRYGLRGGSLEFYTETEQQVKRKSGNLVKTTESLERNCTNVTIYDKSKLYIKGTSTSVPNKETQIDFIEITILERFNQSESNRTLQRPVPDPYALSTSENVLCISNGPEKLTNTIRLQGQNFPTNGNPSAVLIYRTNDSSFYWEKFMPAEKRRFICEKEHGNENSCKDDIPTSQTSDPRDLGEPTGESSSVVWIAVAVASVLIVITIVVVLIIAYKRRRYAKGTEKPNQNSLATLGNTDEKSNVKSAYSSVRKTSNERVEGDYDHLHQQPPALEMSDNVYSHMTDNQYGLLPVMTDDTYDHSVQRDAEYGTTEVSPKSEDTYDHA